MPQPEAATAGDDKKVVEVEEVEMKPVPDHAVPTTSHDESTGNKDFLIELTFYRTKHRVRTVVVKRCSYKGTTLIVIVEGMPWSKIG